MGVPPGEDEIIEHLNMNCRGYYRWTSKISSLKAASRGKIVRRLTEEEEKLWRSMKPAERTKVQGWSKMAAGETRRLC